MTTNLFFRSTMFDDPQLCYHQFDTVYQFDTVDNAPEHSQLQPKIVDGAYVDYNSQHDFSDRITIGCILITLCSGFLLFSAAAAIALFRVYKFCVSWLVAFRQWRKKNVFVDDGSRHYGYSYIFATLYELCNKPAFNLIIESKESKLNEQKSACQLVIIQIL